MARRPFVGQRPGWIELRIARRRKGLGGAERTGAVSLAGSVGGGCVVFRAAGQRCRQQTQAREAHLPKKKASIQKDRLGRGQPLRNLPVRSNNDIGHVVKMPQTRGCSAKKFANWLSMNNLLT